MQHFLSVGRAGMPGCARSSLRAAATRSATLSQSVATKRERREEGVRFNADRHNNKKSTQKKSKHGSRKQKGEGEETNPPIVVHRFFLCCSSSHFPTLSNWIADGKANEGGFLLPRVEPGSLFCRSRLLCRRREQDKFFHPRPDVVEVRHHPLQPVQFSSIEPSSPGSGDVLLNFVSFPVWPQSLTPDQRKTDLSR